MVQSFAAAAAIAGIPMPYLIGYDISLDRRRAAAMKQLRAVTGCWQQSFFVCDIPSHEAIQLFRHLARGLVPEEDGLTLVAAQPAARGAGLGVSCARSLDGVFFLD